MNQPNHGPNNNVFSGEKQLLYKTIVRGVCHSHPLLQFPLGQQTFAWISLHEWQLSRPVAAQWMDLGAGGIRISSANPNIREEVKLEEILYFCIISYFSGPNCPLVTVKTHQSWQSKLEVKFKLSGTAAWMGCLKYRLVHACWGELILPQVHCCRLQLAPQTRVVLLRGNF